MLYAREKNTELFDNLLPDEHKQALSYKHEKLAIIPLITYGIPIAEIKDIVKEGYFFLKIKIGSDPDHYKNLLQI